MSGRDRYGNTFIFAADAETAALLLLAAVGVFFFAYVMSGAKLGRFTVNPIELFMASVSAATSHSGTYFLLIWFIYMIDATLLIASFGMFVAALLQ